MVRFNTSQHRPARNYFSRREQWRLLLLVLALGVVIFAMREVRQPENVSRVARVFSGDQTPATENEGRSSAKAARQAAGAKRLPTAIIRPEALSAIKDNTYFRNAEKEAWFALISSLQGTTAVDLEANSTGEVTYVQLVDQPAAYRAKLVTVRGTARQVTRQEPAANDVGLKSYYRVVIQPSDGSTWPIFVYSLELPEGFPRDEDVAVDITATGFFFKNLSYPWRDGLGIAPVLLAKQVALADPNRVSAAPASPSRAPTQPDIWQQPDERLPVATSEAPSLREVLSLAGWGAERFAQFADDEPLADDNRKQLLDLLWRLRTFDAASIEAWTQTDVSLQDLIRDPAAKRGEMVQLAGRVTHAARHELPAEDAARLEMSAYYTCEIDSANGEGRLTVVTPTVPRAFQQLSTLNEPVNVSALFVTPLSSSGDESKALFVAKRIAWHPETPKEPHVSFGDSLLGTLGMDVGLMDDIRSHGPIHAAEREPFYQMLAAAGKIGANQLARFAQRNLESVERQWAREFKETADKSHRALAQEVVRRANDGRYSVAPLFNDAERQQGQLVSVDGVAQRVVRVDVGSRSDGSGPSDVARRFGIDHYYEMEVFTDDSQNYPLVFCVRELPAGFPSGGQLHAPVRMAAFFFKDWLYRTRRSGSNDASDGNDAAARQYAPLLIGRAPLLLDVEQGGAGVARLVGGGLFLLALGAIWAAAWWFAKSDRKFAERHRAEIFSLPPGQSLNELNLPTENEPMK